jgi:saccharopine dehydrogenase (NAD+, L-lysine-forming)
MPYHFKLDIANKPLKVCVEVDGSSHNSLKVAAADKRKEDFLTGEGWTVLRFSNEQVMEHLEECVQKVLSSISRLKETTTTSLTGS